MIGQVHRAVLLPGHLAVRGGGAGAGLLPGRRAGDARAPRDCGRESGDRGPRLHRHPPPHQARAAGPPAPAVLRHGELLIWCLPVYY